MPHFRTQLRTNLEAQLAGLITPKNVFLERAHRIDGGDLPAVLVSLTGNEFEPGDFSMGDPNYTQQSNQTVLIELHAVASTGPEVQDILDQMDLEVEQALASDITVGGILENLWPGGSEIAVNTDQDIVVAMRSTSYIAVWRSVFGKPDQPEG